MLARLGNVLLWTSWIIAAGWVWLVLKYGVGWLGGEAGQEVAYYLIPAVIVLAIGMALKYS